MVVAVISYRQAYDLVRAHGEAGHGAVVPFTVDGLIWVLAAGRRSDVRVLNLQYLCRIESTLNSV